MVRTTFKPTRERKQRRKVSQVQQRQSPTSEYDPNAEIIVPTDAKAQRRAELQASLSQPKMSSKKAKRLNKYIENKLRKEETNVLLEKLAENKVDTSLFVSAKNIGRAKETKKEKVKRALAELEKGLKGTGAEELLFVEREVRGMEEWNEVAGKGWRDEVMEVGNGEKKENLEKEGDEEMEEVTKIPHPQQIQDSVAHERALLEQSFSVTTVGGGLKRPLEVDESGKPILKRIRRTKAPDELLRATPALVKYDYNKQDEDMKAWDEDDEDEDESSFSMGGESDEEKEDDEDDQDNDDDEEAEEWHGFSDSIQGVTDEEIEVKSSGDSEGSESDEDDDSENVSEDETETDEEDDGPVPRLKKGTSAAASAFKAWAEASRLKALGIDEPKAENNIPIFPKLPPGVVLPRRASSSSPPPQPIPTPLTTSKPAFYVTVNRPEDVQLSRLALPIVALEQPIMEAISANSTVVICGATGSGKTTQVPQFLYEAGYGNPASPDTPGLIGITQPRRVAAVSMANRVQEELGEGHKGKVGYQIRFEGTVGANTAIKFMTDGVLLRELARDFALTKYSAIVIDEAHERGVNTDILIGFMSRVVRLREEMHKEDPTKTKVCVLP